MARIIRESLTAYPGEHLVSALGSTWEQLIKFGTGDGIDRNLWHVRYVLERYQPDLARRHERSILVAQRLKYHIR